MAKLIVMVGLPFSGKTTRAKELAKEYNAIRFTPDKWQLELFGSGFNNDLRIKITNIMTDLAFELLGKGLNVILDIGCWTRKERHALRTRTQNGGFDFAICYCECPEEELMHRLEKRNTSPLHENENHGFIVSMEKYNKYVKEFEIPTKEEGPWI